MGKYILQYVRTEAVRTRRALRHKTTDQTDMQIFSMEMAIETNPRTICEQIHKNMQR